MKNFTTNSPLCNLQPTAESQHSGLNIENTYLINIKILIHLKNLIWLGQSADLLEYCM